MMQRMALGRGLRGFAKACLTNQEAARRNSTISMAEIPSLWYPQQKVTALPDLGLMFSRAKLYCKAASSFTVLLQACGDGHPWES